jgi:hypothetical protein
VPNGKKKTASDMIINSKLIKILRIIASGLMILVLLTLIINIIEPSIEFNTVRFNRFWGFLICYFCLTSFLIVILIFKSFHKIAKWILLVIGIPTVMIAIFYISAMSAKIEYEPHFDRYIAYRNIYKSNQYVVVQDYIKWKPNLPSVDTTFIKDYYLIRKFEHLDSMNVKGTWVRLDEKGKIIDTMTIK